MNRLYWLGRWSNGEFEALFKINSDLSFIWRHNMFFFHVRIPYFILERGWWGVVQQWWWGFCLVPIRFWVGDTYFMFCALCVCVSPPPSRVPHRVPWLSAATISPWLLLAPPPWPPPATARWIFHLSTTRHIPEKKRSQKRIQRIQKIIYEWLYS